MDPRNILSLFRVWRTDPEGARRFRQIHTLPQERFALLFTAIIYTLLAAGDVFGHRDFRDNVIQIAALIAISLVFYLFRPVKFRDVYIHLYSCYYVIIFLLVYYFPLIADLPLHVHPKSYKYLLHLSLLIAQALRPHLRGGGVVMLLLIVHSALEFYFDPRPIDSSDQLRFIVFAWLSLIVLYIERLNFLNSFKFFDLAWRKRREGEELKLAEQVHKNLFPQFKENDSIRLYSRRMSPELTGGDFFDLVYLREGNLGLFFTDISGHGISAAMMSAAVKVVIQGMPYRNRMNPARFLSHVDEVMSAEYGSHHASALYLYLDFQEKLARLANAGHPPLLYSQSGRPFTEVESDGALLGYALRAPIADEIVLPVLPGDRFLFYTDGLLECRGKMGKAFMPHIHDFLDGLERLPADRLIDHLLDRVRERPEFAGFRDDVMLVLIEVK